jgi:hypothetical protein
MPDARFFVVVVTVAMAACTSSEAARPSPARDPYSIYRPSNSSVLFPGEHRGRSINDLPGLWLLE